MPKKQWIFKDKKTDREIVKKLMETTDMPRLAAQAAVNRGLMTSEDVESFKSVEANFFDPFLLPDMDRAVLRIKRAIQHDEHVTIYGDYDADGVTSTSILYRCFRELGINTSVYIPHRIKEGYGLNADAVKKIAAMGVTLIVTVDCGVSCHKEIETAKAFGVDVVVTDHHLCPDILPEAIAVVNPKRKDSVYPFSDLAGVGVAYKLACALTDRKEAPEYAELAAIGTVADVVPLISENRAIVKKGVAAINDNPSVGIRALLRVARIQKEVDSQTIGFIVSPRLNAAGRMGSAMRAFELLNSTERTQAELIAAELDQYNRTRQAQEKKIFDEAAETVRVGNKKEDDVYVLSGRDWHAGVIGVVASKICDISAKPCILISIDENGIGKGSGRSIEGFELVNALKACADCLSQYGGHAQAAGITIEESRIDEFSEKLKEYAKEHLTEDMKIKKLYLDTFITGADLNVKTVKALSSFAPFGETNPVPVFGLLNAQIKDMRVLSDGKHLKLLVEKDGVDLSAIAFSFGYAKEKLKVGQKVHLAGELSVNDYDGKLQLIVRDIAASK